MRLSAVCMVTGFRPRVRRLIVERDDAARTMDVLRIGRRGDYSDRRS